MERIRVQPEGATVGTINVYDDGDGLGLDEDLHDVEASLDGYASVLRGALSARLPEWRVGTVDVGPGAGNRMGRDGGARYDAGAWLALHPEFAGDDRYDVMAREAHDASEVDVLVADLMGEVACEPRYVDLWAVMR